MSEQEERRAGSREDRKLQVLEDFLDHQAGDRAMSLEELDGFFAALHCCPELVLPSEYLPEVFGGADLGNEDLFLNAEHAKLILGLIMDHWNTVGNAFRRKEFFLPLLLEDEQGKAHGNDWAIGFLRGVWMRKDAWGRFWKTKTRQGGSFPSLRWPMKTIPIPKCGRTRNL